MNTNTDRCFFN